MKGTEGREGKGARNKRNGLALRCKITSGHTSHSPYLLSRLTDSSGGHKRDFFLDVKYFLHNLPITDDSSLVMVAVFSAV